MEDVEWPSEVLLNQNPAKNTRVQPGRSSVLETGLEEDSFVGLDAVLMGSQAGQKCLKWKVTALLLPMTQPA